MTAGLVIIREKGSKRLPERFLVEDEDVVQALSSDGSDQPFHLRTLADEFSDFTLSIGPSRPTALQPPVKTKALTMPTNDCFWPDDQQG